MAGLGYDEAIIQTHEVSKSLIIGLGTSGVEICERIAERLEGEYGSLRSCPWVQFLCVETDSGGKRDKLSDDFVTIGFDEGTFNDMRRRPEIFSSIGLQKWMDERTVSKLPEGHTRSGARNIRMIGRMVFLEDQSFRHVKLHLQNRLEILQHLAPQAAQMARGPRPNGDDEPIRFNPPGQIRLYVVGTLCGGTCSGSVCDFGLLLKSLVGQDHAIGVFTLPHPNLSNAEMAGVADRLKVNAKSALEELNHYGQRQEDGTFPVSFSDGTSSFGAFYDEVYLAMPTGPTKAAIAACESSVADWIFMQTCLPAMHSAAAATNETPIPIGGMAQIFSIFGFSTLEFPAYTVMQGATARSFYKMLSELTNKGLSEQMKAQLLRDAGLDPQELLATVKNSSTPPLDHKVTARIAAICEAAKTRPDSARNQVEELRRDLQNGSLIAGNASELGEHLYNSLLTRIKLMIRKGFFDLNVGPAALVPFLKAATEGLAKISEKPSKGSSSLSADVDKALGILEKAKGDALLGVTGLKDKVLKATLAELKDQLTREADEQTLQSVLTLLKGSPQIPGLAPRLQESLELFLKRLEKVRDCLRADSTFFQRLYDKHRESVPDVHGVPLFTTHMQGTEGTVDDEYKRTLEARGAMGVPAFDDLERKHLTELLQQFTTLADDVLRDRVPLDDDTLLKLDSGSKTRLSLQRHHYEGPFKHLRNIFGRIGTINVVDRWTKVPESSDPDSMVTQATKLSRPHPEDRTAEHHAREVRRVFIPKSGGDGASRIFKLVSKDLPNIEKKEGADPHRVVIAQNVIRFPLTRIQSITGLNSLAGSTCHEENERTFYTRRDIRFKPLPIQRTVDESKHCGLIAMAVALKLMRIDGGKLKIKMEQIVTQAAVDLEFPFSIQESSSLIFKGKDDKNQIADDLVEVLYKRMAVMSQEKGGRAKLFDLIDETMEDPALQNLKDHEKMGAYLTHFIRENEEWLEAFIQVRPPDNTTLAETIRRDPGDPNKVLGYYCQKCNRLLGLDMEEAKSNRWTCSANPEHYYGPRYA